MSIDTRLPVPDHDDPIWTAANAFVVRDAEGQVKLAPATGSRTRAPSRAGSWSSSPPPVPRGSSSTTAPTPTRRARCCRRGPTRHSPRWPTPSTPTGWSCFRGRRLGL